MGDSREGFMVIINHQSLPLLIPESIEKLDTEVRKKNPALLLIKLKDPA